MVVDLGLGSTFFRVEDSFQLESIPALQEGSSLCEFCSEFGLFFSLNFFQAVSEAFYRFLVSLLVDFQHGKSSRFGLARLPVYFEGVSVHDLLLVPAQRPTPWLLLLFRGQVGE